MAVIHDACTTDIRDTTHLSPVNSNGSNGAGERAVQSFKGVALTLRLDLLGRTNVAVGSDLPIPSWMGETRGMVVKLAPLMERLHVHDSRKTFLAICASLC